MYYVSLQCFSLWNSGVVVILLLYVNHQQSSQTALCLFPTCLLSFPMCLLLFWGHWLIDNTLMKNLAYVPVYLVLWCSSSHDLIGLPFLQVLSANLFSVFEPMQKFKNFLRFSFVPVCNKPSFRVTELKTVWVRYEGSGSWGSPECSTDLKCITDLKVLSRSSGRKSLYCRRLAR